MYINIVYSYVHKYIVHIIYKYLVVIYYFETQWVWSDPFSQYSPFVAYKACKANLTWATVQEHNGKGHCAGSEQDRYTGRLETDIETCQKMSFFIASRLMKY